MIDILYVSYNRAEFTRESFHALLAHTNWNEVDTLFIADDASDDGAYDAIQELGEALLPDSVNLMVNRGKFKGPVAATNWYLDLRQPQYDPNDPETIQSFVKIDNDFVVCPGYLDELLHAAHFNPGIDLIGMEPMTGPAVRAPALRAPIECQHIGGKGLIRIRAFDQCRPRPRGFNGYQGFTQWQSEHPGVTKAWLTPELPVFGLDQLPFEPWRSLAALYESKGWARRWPSYSDDMDSYWGWWTPMHTLPDVPTLT